MSLAADLTAFVQRGRAMSEEVMPDTVHLYRPGEPIFDRDTGTTVPGPPAIDFYDGAARVKKAQLSANQVQAGETELNLRQYTVKLPYATVISEGRPEPGDVADVTASDDDRMVGLRLWVVSIEYGSTSSSWRIVAEDRQEGQR